VCGKKKVLRPGRRGGSYEAAIGELLVMEEMWKEPKRKDGAGDIECQLTVCLPGFRFLGVRLRL
jgi:hypothetical protein